MCAFVDDLLLHTRHSVEDDGSRAAADVVEGVLDNHTPQGKGEGQAVYILEHFGHGVELEGEVMRTDDGDDVCFSVAHSEASKSGLASMIRTSNFARHFVFSLVVSLPSIPFPPTPLILPKYIQNGWLS